MSDIDLSKSAYWNTIEWTPEMIARVVDLRGQRWSCERIGAEIGVSDRAVKSQLARMGMPARLPAIMPTTHEEARAMHVTRPERVDPLAAIRRALPSMPIAPARSCQYPEGDERPFRFCDAPIWRGSYCECHWRVCHSQVWAA